MHHSVRRIVVVTSLLVVLCVCIWLGTRNSTEHTINIDKRVLILGGNGFIGSQVVASLIPTGANLTLLNRGNEYHDPDDVPVPDSVSRITCNREIPGDCEASLKAIAEESGPFDFTIDFSGLWPDFVANTLNDLKKASALHRSGLYIYISSDSVYEVVDTESSSTGLREAFVGEKTKLSEDGRQSRDQYARDKFESEMVLRDARAKGGGWMPQVLYLRLPDVFGPGDTSPRFFNYLVWVKLHKVLGFPIRLVRTGNQVDNPEDETPLSFVFSQDVGTFLAHQVLPQWHAPHQRAALGDQALNLAFLEPSRPLRALIDEIGAEVFQGVSPGEESRIEYELSPRQTSGQVTFYPSVTKGPVSTERLEAFLEGGSGWSTTPRGTAIKRTIEYFEKLLDRILSDPEQCIDKFYLERFARTVGVQYNVVVDALKSLKEKQRIVEANGSKEL